MSSPDPGSSSSTSCLVRPFGSRGPGSTCAIGASSAAWKSGPAVFKIDWALDGPIPWLDDTSPRAGTVHVGGTWEEVIAAEDTVHRGGHPERPFVLVAQQSVFDPSPGPRRQAHRLGLHPRPEWLRRRHDRGRSSHRLERFAPGFKDLVIGRHIMNAAGLEAHNPNYIGGDIAGGGFGPRKVFQFGSTGPYRIGDRLYLCSSATPPGAGVHGMCGFYAARAALND